MIQTAALAPTLSKIFKWCILIDHGSAFTTSSLQFGFKHGLSTRLCTGLIKNVVARYSINDSSFRVNHSILFDKLLQRILSPRTLLTGILTRGCVSLKMELQEIR